MWPSVLMMRYWAPPDGFVPFLQAALAWANGLNLSARDYTAPSAAGTVGLSGSNRFLTNRLAVRFPGATAGNIPACGATVLRVQDNTVRSGAPASSRA